MYGVWKLCMGPDRLLVVRYTLVYNCTPMVVKLAWCWCEELRRLAAGVVDLECSWRGWHDYCIRNVGMEIAWGG